ncbi:MAG: DUF4846 domain-containing protein [Chitinophagaceae bacterium]
MQPNLLMSIILPILVGCSDTPISTKINLDDGTVALEKNPYNRVEAIPLPNGYSRIPLETGSFGEWLRNFPLKESRTVYLFNGTRKRNQSAQFAVLNLSTGNKDLQQCADAVMRLRAEYLYEQKKYSSISFSDNNGTNYQLSEPVNRIVFDKYLEKVFTWCGSLSLKKQLKSIDMAAIVPGDILIKGGSPGHAAIVMDVAINRKGQKIYMVANSYMPAQDVHIVVNPTNKDLSPWFAMDADLSVDLPEWSFTVRQLRRW